MQGNGSRDLLEILIFQMGRFKLPSQIQPCMLILGSHSFSVSFLCIF